MSYWQSGHQLQEGRYVIEKVLGAGGSGVTYLAGDRHLNQSVAIKTLNAMMQTREDFEQQQAKFVQEAFRLAKCSHQHIVDVRDVCQDDPLWCMVMEHINGGTLGQYAIKRKRLPEAEALRYIQQIGAALSYLHRQSVLHRDVKPSNIMLRPKTLEAVLIDFGLARDFMEGETQTHTNSRTESFAPIEQYEKRAKRGAYTDVYALAATLYYILTLKLPFPAPIRQQGAGLIDPKQHNEQISDHINRAILQGMAVEPQDRVQSIQAWLHLLQDASAGTRLNRSAIKPRSSSRSEPLSTRSSPTPPAQTRSSDPSRASQRFASSPYAEGKRMGNATPKPHPVSVKPSPLAQEPTNVPFAALPPAQKKVYQPLHDFLATSQWKQADGETDRLILQLSSRAKEGWLNEAVIAQMPGQDLAIINQLWLKYSRQKFGFSVQKRLYQSLGGMKEYNQFIWEMFGELVGWRMNNEWLYYGDFSFDLSAPPGHLPAVWGRIRGGALLLRDEFQ